MKNILITINEDHTVDFENDYAGLNLENLQGNITFQFKDFIYGQARAEIVINNQDGYIELEQIGETYNLPIKSSLLTGDSILMQLVIDQPPVYKKTTDTTIQIGKTYYEKVGESYVVVEEPILSDIDNYYEAEIPVWKSEVFFLKVGCSINATTTIPEEYPSWIEIINGLITQTENAISRAGNVNISSEQLTDGVKVITTNQDGEQTITIVPQGPQGEPGVPGAIKTIPVETLPTENIETDAIYLLPMPKIEVASLPATGEPNTIYIVISTQKRYVYSSNQWIEISQDNNYLEYMYINANWELLGTMSMQVDLTDYVKFTDYPDYNKGGVVKKGNGFTVNGSGGASCGSDSYADYQTKSVNQFISKGTLENVLTASVMSSSNTAPTSSTKGRLGQLHINTTDNSVYQLVAISGNTYTWVQNTNKSYVDGLVGDISSVLDAINGEVI